MNKFKIIVMYYLVNRMSEMILVHTTSNSCYDLRNMHQRSHYVNVKVLQTIALAALMMSLNHNSHKNLLLIEKVQLQLDLKEKVTNLIVQPNVELSHQQISSGESIKILHIFFNFIFLHM